VACAAAPRGGHGTRPHGARHGAPVVGGRARAGGTVGRPGVARGPRRLSGRDRDAASGLRRRQPERPAAYQTPKGTTRLLKARPAGAGAPPPAQHDASGPDARSESGGLPDGGGGPGHWQPESADRESFPHPPGGRTPSRESRRTFKLNPPGPGPDPAWKAGRARAGPEPDSDSMLPRS
jgi:hypothetical protein